MGVAGHAKGEYSGETQACLPLSRVVARAYADGVEREEFHVQRFAKAEDNRGTAEDAAGTARQELESDLHGHDDVAEGAKVLVAQG